MIKVRVPQRPQQLPPDFVFRDLISNPAFYQEDELTTLREFNYYLLNSSVLYYPSSGNDFTDLIYINKSIFEREDECMPHVFIHSDFRIGILPGHIDDGVAELNFKIISSVECRVQGSKFCNIYKFIQNNSGIVKWLIDFGGYYNEDVLQIILNNNLKIDIIYAVCDGITHGMGAIYKNSIPTILYPLLAKDLSLKFILTEQTFNDINRLFEDNPGELRNYLEIIIPFTKNQKVVDLLELDDSSLKAKILDQLKEIRETSVNTEDNLKIPDPRFDIFLKTIHL